MASKDDAGRYLAVDSDGYVTTVPDVAIDAAIERGLPWSRPVSVGSEPVPVDVSEGPVRLSTLLDASVGRWAISDAGTVVPDA